jgi:hypothetical protein
LQNETHRGKRRRGRPVRPWKDGIRDSVERRNLKDEEYFDRELWREKLCIHRNACIYNSVVRHLNYTRELTVVLDSQSEIKVSVNFALHNCHV